MSDFEFAPFVKIPRLLRDIVITEKIDGTNVCVQINESGAIMVQSRNRFIEPSDDHHGFAKWVCANADGLRDILGPGRHFGEWWGSGVGRNYGLAKGEKRLSLFNTSRWSYLRGGGTLLGLDCVPVIYEGEFHTDVVHDSLELLRNQGSLAAPGYMKPEGVVVFHTAANSMFKATLVKDDEWKGKQ